MQTKKIDRKEIARQAKMELARREFWEYCKLTAPDFYNEGRPFLFFLAVRLQDFIFGNKKIFVVNMPPRHGKSRTAGLFAQWLFGINTNYKIMTGSYNKVLSSTFAKSVRDTILAEPTLGTIVYNDIFPKTKIKYGESSAEKWALDGSNVANYLATSPKGTATGFGCNVMIIDDLIKSAAEAYNENVLNQHISWFNNTMLSRTEHGFKLIIIMTRWATNDLAGYILDNFEDVEHINYKAMQDDGSMLCEEILSKADYEFKTKHTNKDIVLANYQQEPIDIQGRLYSNIKTYDEIPKDDSGKPLFNYILNYTDTADTGSDYLCSINYGMYNNDYYVLNVLYTKESMEYTEPKTAEMLAENNVQCAIIESNNGGRGFARNVQRECKERGNNHTTIHSFHQSQNKISRILSNSTGVMNRVLFPKNWIDKFPDFATAILRFQKEGKNEHDDAPDCLTGVYENPKPKNKWVL